MDLIHEPLASLTAACREETSRFQRGEASRNDFCWEVVRRAICDRDEAAWAAVITQYRGIVVAWIRQHSASAESHEGDDYWINRVFERLWLAVGPDRFSLFPDLPALLKYLKMCVHSVLMDEVRARRAVQLESLDVLESVAGDAGTDMETLTVGDMAGRELWQVIAQEVPDETERLVIYWSFALGLKPGEIQERSPERYASVGDVYRIKRNVLERLRRSQRIKQFAA